MDLQQLLDDPLAADPQQIEALLKSAENEAEADPEGATETDPPTTDDDDSGAAANPAADPPAIDAAPVATRDGKATIPFKVLQDERAARQAAEQALQAEQAKLAEMQRVADEMRAKLAAQQEQAAGGQVDRTPDVTLYTPEELAAMEGEYPELAKGFRAMQTLIGNLTERLDRSEQRHIETTRETGKQTVQATLAEVPKLAALHKRGGRAFDVAIQIEKELRADPEWAGKSMKERFVETVARYEKEFGPIAVGSTPPPQQTRTTTPPKSGPNTLSDLPGGALPGRSDIETLSEINAMDLTEKLMAMTFEQQQEYLARVNL